MADDFAHLHLHSQYSLLDGAIRLDDLAPTIKERGMTSVAVTDHGNMFGALQHYKKAKASGIKPIFGCEAYVSEGDAAAKTDRKNYHLVLLARNEVGFANLQRLVSYGHTHGFYYNPRIDRALLRKHSEGLIGLSACLGGHISRLISEDGSGLDQARAAVLEYRDIFEPDSYFLELQPSGTPRQELVNAKLAELGHALGVPLVATNDCHYVDRAEAHAHEVLMCIGMGKTIDDPTRIAHGVDEFFIKTPAQMEGYFTRYPDALDNARRIALACNVELKLGKPELPHFNLPDGAKEDIPTYLRKVANEGLERRLEEAARRGEQPVRKLYTSRIDYELDMIIKMGFAGYFLIVWDFIRHARERGIAVGPGRGSGAGSLVAYSMQITDLDPIHYRLLFERFLNPERVSMPDFDIDLCMNRRQEVIDYVVERYGHDRVGQIATFQGLLPKSVIKDVCRVKGVSVARATEITKLLPDDGNCSLVTCLIDPIKLHAAMREAPKEEAAQIAAVLGSVAKGQPLRDACKADRATNEIVRTGAALEGLTRHAGVHGAGVVIGNKPLVEIVPCWAQDDRLVTQYAMEDVEAAGLVKFDFLGLTTLTVIERTVEQIRSLPMEERRDPLSQTGAEFDLAAIPMDDRRVYRMLSRGDTSGVFQLESSGMRSLLSRLRPDCFEDISATGALYRPGPLEGGMVNQYVECKHGCQQIVYPHPLLEPVLKDTYGVFVYQEQVITAAQVLAGFTLGGADIMRRAMGKKKAQEMGEQRGKFIDGCIRENGLSFKAAADIFALIDKFAGYGFGRAHAAAYGMISYRTAYLKRYYPEAFMAALMSCAGKAEKLSSYIQGALSMGLRVLPPDVNISGVHFNTEKLANGTGLGIRFGLSAIKDVGFALAKEIVEARKDEPFWSVFDLCGRVSMRKLALQRLIAVGALDSSAQKQGRATLLASTASALAYGQKKQADAASEQASLFSADKMAIAQPDYTVVPPLSLQDQLQAERGALGFYLTEHPLDAYEAIVNETATAKIAGLGAQYNDVQVNLVVVISAIRQVFTKRGDEMAVLTVEDRTGTLEVVVFPRVWGNYSQVLLAASSAPVILVGRGDIRELEESKMQMFLDSARPCPTPKEASEPASTRDFLRVATFHVDESMLTDERIEKLKVLLDNPSSAGTDQLRVCVTIPDKARVYVSLSERVAINEGVMMFVERVFESRLQIESRA